jgi:hypothetical protein
MASNTTTRRSTSDAKRTNAVIAFLNLGFKDYLASRVVLNAHLPLQGAILASTTVEKHLKALLSIRGEMTKGHLQKAHFNSLKNFAPELSAKLNQSFLGFLQKVYALRYHDQLRPNFNISIGAMTTLAELDFTINEVRRSIHLRREDSGQIRTAFDIALEGRDERLYRNNHILLQIPREDFLRQPEYCYETRMRPDGGLLEVEYTAETGRLYQDFLVEALRPIHQPPKQ